MSATLVEFGHDISGLDANKPANADPGCRYFATDTGILYFRHATGWQAMGSAGTNGTPNGATVTASEQGNGVIHKTVLSLASTPVTVANVTGASFGGVKLYDFPAARILVLGCVANLGFDWSGTDIAETGSGDYAVGTTITADATLATTDVDLCPSTAMTDPAVAGVAAATVGTLAASAQFDGSGTPIEANLNVIIDDADVANAASDVVLASGTVTITWLALDVA